MDSNKLRRVYKLLSKLKDVHFIVDDSEKDILIDLFSSQLEEEGYSVVNRMQSVETPFTKFSQLPEYFYELYTCKFPNKLLPAVDKKTDLNAARLFVKKRMEATKITRKAALNECALIIKTFIDNIEVFKLQGVVSFSIFGISAWTWVINNTLDIINKDNITLINNKIREKELHFLEHSSDPGLDNIEVLIDKLKN